MVRGRLVLSDGRRQLTCGAAAAPPAACAPLDSLARLRVPGLDDPRPAEGEQKEGQGEELEHKQEERQQEEDEDRPDDHQHDTQGQAADGVGGLGGVDPGVQQ